MRFLFFVTVLVLSFATTANASDAKGAAPTPRVYMVGDSTMANKPLDLPERGWGMALGQFLRDPAMVQNHAQNGRSTKSFIDEGRWEKVRSELRPGDFVIIQFAHNDEKKEDPKRYAAAETDYQENLRRFIREAREKGASPIVATPVCRRKFDKAGKLVDTHAAYPEAARQAAKLENVPLLDLTRDTARWLQEAGDEPSRKFFMWIEAGAHPKIPDGRKDDTHFVAAGAEKVAELAIAEIKAQKLPLAAWLK